MPEPKETKPRAGNLWLDLTLLAATLGACAIALSPNPADPDLWGHVQYGRDALQEGLPYATTYSFTATDYRWINHENLSELLLAIGVDTIGPVAMLSVKCGLGLLIVLSIVLAARRQKVALLSICVIALLVSINLTYFWSMRPQLMSILCYTALLVLFGRSFRDWEGHCRLPWFDRTDDGPQPELSTALSRTRWLWLAVPLFVIWTNSHGGFVAGLCIFTAYLGLRGCEAWFLFGREGLPLLRRFALIGFCTIAASFLNPYGPNLHLWLLASLGAPRPEILEWHPPDLTSTIMLPLWLIMFVWLAASLLTRRSRDFTHMTILALTLWQSLEHVRHVPFFALPFGFWMAIHVDSVLRRFSVLTHAQSVRPKLSPKVATVFATLLVLTFGLLGSRLQSRLSDMPVARSEYPVSAFQFMADEELSGRLIVTYNWAQYAIAAFGNEADNSILVSFDGRFRTCYPQDVVDMNFDFTLGHLEPRYRETPEFNDELALEYGSPDLVLINRKQPHSTNVMFRQGSAWCLLYQDSICQVWGRSSRFDEPGSEDFVPTERRRVTEEIQTGTVTWPALPIRSVAEPHLASAEGRPA